MWRKALVRRAFKKVMRVIKTRNFRKLTNAQFRVSFSFSSDHLLRRVLSFRCIQEILGKFNWMTPHHLVGRETQALVGFYPTYKFKTCCFNRLTSFPVGGKVVDKYSLIMSPEHLLTQFDDSASMLIRHKI